MGATKIEWATDTWNPVTGCTKVSEGCRHCYAERQVERFGHRVHSLGGMHSHLGERFTRVIYHEDKLDEPLHWRKPRRVFVCSMSDLFHPDVPDDFVFKVFDRMAAAPRHTFMVLTKRPDRMRAVVEDWLEGYDPLHNVIGMVSVEDQDAANSRVPLLLQTPFAVRGVSYEPALGPVDLRAVPMPDGDTLGTGLHNDGTDSGLRWVICGGESGTKARPLHPDWARSMRDQCQAAGVPFFFKQWGEWIAETRPGTAVDLDTLAPNESVAYGDGKTNHTLYRRVGKKAAGRELDGKVWDQVPGGMPCP